MINVFLNLNNNQIVELNLFDLIYHIHLQSKDTKRLIKNI